MSENTFEVFKAKKKLYRRKLLKTLALLPVISSLPLNAKETVPKREEVQITINGDLDDDLIILKANETSWDIEACYQMHNPSEHFFLEGRVFPRVDIPGYIEYNKFHTLNENDVLIVTLANEREEREPDKELLDRTHYKSVPLYVNGKEAIPSMIPEKGDIDYTTWFDPNTLEGEYNYYRLWENAVVNVLIIVPRQGKYTVDLINKNDSVSATIDINITNNKVINPFFKKTIAGPIQQHPLAEIDGGVFMHEKYRKPNDKRVRDLAAYHLLITLPNGKQIITPLPYPFPYINRLFFVAKDV